LRHTSWHDADVTISSARWILGGCNLPLETGRLRRPWGLAVLRVLQSSVAVRPILAKQRWEVAFQGISTAEQIQLPFGQGVRLMTPDGEAYFYTYEAARLVAELAHQEVKVRAETARLRFADLPR
jgi:hypothetical protein